MSSAVSRTGRRILGHLGPDADLLSELASVCAAHEVGVGTVRGVGSLRAAALRRLRGRGALELSAPLELLSLEGRVGGQHDSAADLRAVLLCDRGAGSEVVGGVLERATTEAVDYSIDACDDIALPRRAGTEPAPAVEPEASEPAPPARLSWADVAAASAAADEASAAARAPEPEEDEVRVEPGDVIEHPRFKRCTVYKVEGDHEFVQVALRNGRIVRLSLEVLKLRPAGVENGQRVFRALIA